MIKRYLSGKKNSRLVMDSVIIGKVLNFNEIYGTVHNKYCLSNDYKRYVSADTIVNICNLSNLKSNSSKINQKGIQIIGAVIDKSLDLSHYNIDIPMNFVNCVFIERIKMVSARTKTINLSGCCLKKGIDADGIAIDGDFLLKYLRSYASIDFQISRINGRLDMDGCVVSRSSESINSEVLNDVLKLSPSIYSEEKNEEKINIEKSKAVNVGQSTILGGITLRKSKFFGSVDMYGLNVNGSVEISAIIRGSGGRSPNEYSIDISRSFIKDNLVFDGSKLRGKLYISDLKVDLIEFKGTTINGKSSDGIIMDAERIKVYGDLLIYRNCIFNGDVRMASCRISGSLWIGKFINEGERNSSKAPMFSGVFDLGHAKVEHLKVNPDTWVNDDGKVGSSGNWMDGFEFSFLSDENEKQISTENKASKLIALISGASSKRRAGQCNDEISQKFYPQPYENLAKVLRNSGHFSAAREVLKMKGKEEFSASICCSEGKSKKVITRILNILLSLTGYGHDILPAIKIASGIVIVCGFLFNAAYYNGYMGISKEVVYMDPKNIKSEPKNGPTGNADFWDGVYKKILFFLPQDYKIFHEKGEMSNWPPDEYTNFSGFWYSLDVFLPLVNLHQEESWLPMLKDGISGRILGIIAWLTLWLEILAGWILSTLIVASLTGIIKKD